MTPNLDDFMDENGLITIGTAKYYSNAEYWPVMPEPIFDALESAVLEGKDHADVPAGLFDKMMSDAKKLTLNTNKMK